MLAHPDVASKEAVIRRYDHEVQGATVIKSLVGVASDGPSDAPVLKPMETEGWQGLALGCGINPHYGRLDPYAMAWAAVDEALRNVVCVGADPDRVALLDNFCWGSPRLPDRLGGLVRAAQGCHDAAVAYGAPFISGKDSLNNEYVDPQGVKRPVPPTLLVSSLGIVPDARQAVTMDLKVAGNLLYVMGDTEAELGGSLYHRLHGGLGSSVPAPRPEAIGAMRAVHRAMRAGWVLACHDCSEGGLAVAAAEMALAGRLGLELKLVSLPRPTGIGRDDLHFSAEAEQAIRHYSWPGNVRELENAVERAVILSESAEISAELLGIDIELSDLEEDDILDNALVVSSAANASHEPTEDLSLEDYFQHFVLEHQDHMTETELARKLGVSRKCLWERRQRLGIPRRKSNATSE